MKALPPTLTLKCAAALLVLVGSSVSAQVQEITGTADMSVVEFGPTGQIQHDTNHDAVPAITPTFPAVARSRLDHSLPNGGVSAAGQGLAMLHDPNRSGSGTPNDVGLDLGAFSDDATTSWVVDGTVTENRTIVLTTADLGIGAVVGKPFQVESRILLSGVMLLTAMNSSTDLTGVEADLTINVIQRITSTNPQVVFSGEVLLGGGPNGDVSIQAATGPFAGMSLPIQQFPEVASALPLVRAITFAGVEMKYQYDVLPGEPFELTLIVESRARAEPNGTGAAAVFGLPQAGLAAVLQRVKGDDRGQLLTDAVAARVDTTGQAYNSTPAPPAASWGALFPFCGGFGLEATGWVAGGCGLWAMRPRRRRARDRQVLD